MMGETKANYRRERIERLLDELRYEVTRGIMEHEVDEHLGFRFIVPVSEKIRDGVVACEFRTRPVPRGHYGPDDNDARLRVIEGGRVA